MTLLTHRAPFSDAEFRRAFLTAAIPQDQWDHLAHLRVAWLALDAFSFQDALAAVRRGIKTLNEQHGAAGGYHETLTIAWLRVVDAAMGDHLGVHSLDFLIRHPALSNSKLLRAHYRRAHILQPQARHRFLPADLAPLPLGPRYAAAAAKLAS